MVNRMPRAGWIVVLLVIGVSAAGVRWFGPRASRPRTRPASPEAVLAELLEGNSRFAASSRVRSIDTEHDAELRHEQAAGQHPIAAVLCCSDSRVCPEILFDQPVGSLFEIRNAGNLVDEDVLASFEYAVEHLHVPLVVVLGHTRCGAVAAVHEANDQPLPDHLAALQAGMAGLHGEYPCSAHDHSDKCLNGLSLANARIQARKLIQCSSVLAAAHRAGTIRVVVGLYDLESGRVELAGLQPRD